MKAEKKAEAIKEKAAAKSGEPIELTDKQMEEVNGGMKFGLVDIPKLFRPLLRFFFKTKPKETGNAVTEPIVTEPICADGGDTDAD